MSSVLTEQIAQVKNQIHLACQRAGRTTQSVRLVMVSKTVAPEKLRLALQSGETVFGENKAQELKQKALQLQDTQAYWHFIGHLQSNKIKEILPFTSLLHSLDRLSLAQKLNQQLASTNARLKVLIQVNTSYEDSKSGVAPEQALELIKQVSELSQLELKGLMTIGLLGGSQEATRDGFRRLRELQQQAQQLDLPDPSLPELSMGMSHDFIWAIEEGATLVRIGSAIFGSRPKP